MACLTTEHGSIASGSCQSEIINICVHQPVENVEATAAENSRRDSFWNRSLKRTNDKMFFFSRIKSLWLQHSLTPSETSQSTRFSHPSRPCTFGSLSTANIISKINVAVVFKHFKEINTKKTREKRKKSVKFYECPNWYGTEVRAESHAKCSSSIFTVCSFFYQLSLICCISSFCVCVFFHWILCKVIVS